MWVKGYEQETRRRKKKKTEVAKEHPKILDLTSQGNANGFPLHTKPLPSQSSNKVR